MDNLDKKRIQQFLNSSWDIKLTKYLSNGSCGPVDLYVFDHGFNESVIPGMFNDMLDKPEDPLDRTYFLGAMAFLFKKILDDNYKAKILIIGHYMNAKTQGGIKDGIDKCCAAQEQVAADWGFPIIKTWEHMRLSNNLIRVNDMEIPVFQAYFPDGVHPSSDKTGYALKYYAEILAPLIENIR